MNTITTNETALNFALGALISNSVRYDSRTADKAAILYGKYAAEYGVTLETVGKHVKALQTQEFPGVKPSSKAAAGTREYMAHTFGCRIRKGLNTALGKVTTARVSTALLTSLGVQSTREQVIAAWEAAQA